MRVNIWIETTFFIRYVYNLWFCLSQFSSISSLLLAAYFISLYFLKIFPLSTLLMLSLLFFRSRTAALTSWEKTKSRNVLIFFYVLLGLSPHLLNSFDTDFRVVNAACLSFQFFFVFFILCMRCLSVAFFLLRAFFSSSNRAIFLCSCLSLCLFSFLEDSPRFGKFIATKKGCGGGEDATVSELVLCLEVSKTFCIAFECCRCSWIRFFTSSLLSFNSCFERSVTFLWFFFWLKLSFYKYLEPYATFFRSQ